jgi:DNA polymerase III epsilon subunit-like protein
MNLVEQYKDGSWVFFDTETTGLMYKEKQVQATQIACLAYDIKGFAENTTPEVIGKFNVKINLSPDSIEYMKNQEAEIATGSPNKFSMKNILKMNRYGDKTAPFLKPEQAAVHLEEFLDTMRTQSVSGKIVMIAQNSPFDVGILNTLYQRLDREPPDDETWDTKAALQIHLHPILLLIKNDPDASEEDKEIVQKLFAAKRNGEEAFSSSLGIVVKAFNLKDKGWHDALADVDMTMDMLATIIQFVRKKKNRYSVDTSTVPDYDAMAGDPHSPRRKY